MGDSQKGSSSQSVTGRAMEAQPGNNPWSSPGVLAAGAASRLALVRVVFFAVLERARPLPVRCRAAGGHHCIPARANHNLSCPNPASGRTERTNGTTGDIRPLGLINHSQVPRLSVTLHGILATHERQEAQYWERDATQVNGTTDPHSIESQLSALLPYECYIKSDH